MLTHHPSLRHLGARDGLSLGYPSILWDAILPLNALEQTLNHGFSYGCFAGVLALALMLTACGPSSNLSDGSHPGYDAQQAAVVTTNGTQQFAVPQSGRVLLARRLVQLVAGHITDARISNAWRTATAAQTHPDDYAACVSADAGRGSQIFLIVKSGPGTGDVISGAKAAERCADIKRVRQWTTLPEAMAQS